MATLQERIETATDVLETDAGLMHSIIHGGSTETVETEGGPVPTVAKQVADMEASYAAIDAVAVVAADRLAAETARGGAEDARDVAVAATANMLVKGNNLSDVPDAAAARDNLGVTEAIAATGMPVGSVMMLYGDDSEAPPGYLLMNGAAVTATYPELRAFGLARGWQVNAGGDPLLPDMGGYFPRGWRSGQTVDSARVFGVVQSDAIRNITGIFHGGDHSEIASGVFAAGANIGTITGGTGATKIWSLDASRVVPTADENRPANVTFTFWIKAYPAVVDTGSIDLANLTNDIQGVAVRTTALETAIGDGQPDYDSGNVSYTNGGLITLSHGLGVTPRDVQVFLKATATNTAGIAVGSMIWKFPNQSYQHQGHMVICDSTNITIRVGTAGIAVFNTSGNAVDASVSAFVLVVHAYKPVSAT